MSSNDLFSESSESQILKDLSSQKKIPKRQRAEMTEEQGIAELIEQYQNNFKKTKLEVNNEACKEFRQKVMVVMNHQLKTRKERSNTLLKHLSEVMIHLEADCYAMKDNEKKLKYLTGLAIKYMHQATKASKQKLKSLKDIYASFKKQCEEMESDHKTENEKIADELENYIKQLTQNTIFETRRSCWNNFHRIISNAIQDDF